MDICYLKCWVSDHRVRVFLKKIHTFYLLLKAKGIFFLIKIITPGLEVLLNQFTMMAQQLLLNVSA